MFLRVHSWSGRPERFGIKTNGFTWPEICSGTGTYPPGTIIPRPLCSVVTTATETYKSIIQLYPLTLSVVTSAIVSKSES